jgi:2-polyprenyl-6-methoxyphenol hydroxylase-like FAD-dependent oxidoreductase
VEKFDVIVIGGSVAGASTAMLLARRGYDVLLVERETFPRDTLSTHFIWPRGMTYLNRWGLAERILSRTPHSTHMNVTIEGISFAGSVPVAALQERFRTLHGDSEGVTNTYCGPRRYLLDQILLDEAASSGADVRQAVTFTQTIEEAGVVKGICATTASGTTIMAHAPLVIGADGRFSTFAKAVGAQTKDYRELSTFAFFGYFKGIELNDVAIHKRGRLGTAMFPTSDGSHMSLVYGPTEWWSEFKADAEENFFRTFEFCAPEMGERLRGAKREERFKGCGTMPAFQLENVGPGWALVGDAGSFKDQVTAMGITHAFRDAELITNYIHTAFSGKLPLDQALATYQQVRAADYEEYFDLVCHIAEMNAYTRAELEHFHALSKDQARVDEFMAQFGDTVPLSASGPEPEVDVASLPAHIRDFDRIVPEYLENPYRAVLVAE